MNPDSNIAVIDLAVAIGRLEQKDADVKAELARIAEILQPQKKIYSETLEEFLERTEPEDAEDDVEWEEYYGIA